MKKAQKPRENASKRSDPECEEAGLTLSITTTLKAIEKLMNGLSPSCAQDVQKHLESKNPETVQLLVAWAKAGVRDAGRIPRLDLGPECRRTMTGLGVACLVTYARAWVDTAEVRAAEVRRLLSSRGDGPRSARPDLRTAGPARAT